MSVDKRRKKYIIARNRLAEVLQSEIAAFSKLHPEHAELAQSLSMAVSDAITDDIIKGVSVYRRKAMRILADR